MKYILNEKMTSSDFRGKAGGKAAQLARLSIEGFSVPEWFCISSDCFREFVEWNRLNSNLVHEADLDRFEREIEILFLRSPLPEEITNAIDTELEARGFYSCDVAVRSSGLDEDSEANSFAGQFSTFLFQRGKEQIFKSIKRCWASAYSARALSYRKERGLSQTQIQMGVVIQRMINPEVSGVSFSRNPMSPLDRDNLVVSSVWGLGEGLVSGELDADHFEVNRKTLAYKMKIARKAQKISPSLNGGIVKEAVESSRQEIASLSNDQLQTVARITLEVEKKFKLPQDCEWGIEKGRLFLLQARPISSLPKEEFFNSTKQGDSAILWDNSNIIESYSGVTSPLTFSFASNAYRQVYIQFCQLVGVPDNIISENEPMFRNMLGLIRGRIYYNLIQWYRLVLLLPGAANNKGLMETMMGVKQSLSPELARKFDEMVHPPKYSFLKRLFCSLVMLYRFARIDSIIDLFRTHFDNVYESTRNLPFKSLSVTELTKLYQRLDDQLLRRWQAPILNDYLCMVFFGVLKKLTESWVAQGNSGASLQNDLLCGQGDLESTEPTKMLMRIAEKIDQGDSVFRAAYLSSDCQDIWKRLKEVENLTSFEKSIATDLRNFLDKYGFRCVNELKLEERDLHDDPGFVIAAIANYVRMKSYSIVEMERRERLIRDEAETVVKQRLSPLKRIIYFWIVKQARKAVKNRENLRFARTKIFGVARHIFRAMGDNFEQLGILAKGEDIFYLTVEEILGFVEGRGISLRIQELVELRKTEYTHFKKSPAPPDRLITHGIAGTAFLYPQILAELDLLRSQTVENLDPNTLLGTPCCPGIIEGTVRVVETLQDAIGMNGEILVAARTDPGWVPLFPACSGLLIERGSLLSHSAVVARELGLPTIVGISGGLMTKLKTGQKVRVDAGKGEVRIIA